MIDAKHQIPLATAITASAPGRRALVEALYREACALFFNTAAKEAGGDRTRTSAATGANFQVSASVMDSETGLFVQLNGELAPDGQAVSGPFLTYGKKYLVEAKNAQLSNTAVRLWK